LTKYFVIAGESSGDILGAGLMDSLRALDPSAQFAGVGGEEMARRGLRSLFDIGDIAVMGIFEVLRHYFAIRRRIRDTVGAIREYGPDVVVTIDSPGFNFRVVKAARKFCRAKFAHYVAPSVWAWKPKRALRVARLYDALLCFFDFERKYFARHGLKTFVVGHPAIGIGGDAGMFRKVYGEGKFLVLLPGSRPAMARRLLPVYRDALAMLPGYRPVVPVTATSRDFIAGAIRDWPVEPIVIEGLQERYDAFAAASAAIAISGTSVLELVLMKVPTVVAYKVSPLTYFIARMFLRIRNVSLPNIIMRRRIVPELIQGACTAKSLAAAMNRPWKDFPRDAAALRRRLDVGAGPSDLAARAVLSVA
jgi:lipid-A-disaccharide synthase